MDKRAPTEQQRVIGAALQVQAHFDPQQAAERCRDFLCAQLEASGQQALVLGISGGVDSTVAGRLAQLAVEKARHKGRQATFVAMRLPYGEQKDEADAQRALQFIKPDEALSTNIQPASDAMLDALEAGGLVFRDAAHRDFILGNIKARQRMIAQYAVAGARRGLVVGTDQAAEALMGFFTKYGDGACDFAPLTGLSKRQVREVGAALGAPGELVDKIPTADLESLSPMKTDEEAFGVSYEEIDDFLEGKPVSERAYRIIVSTYSNTMHKRNLPITPG